MRQILYLMQKEFRQIIRSKVMLGILFIAPLIQLLVIGNAVTTDVTNITIVFYDNDRTPLSRELIQQFTSSRYFKPVAVEEDYTKLPGYLDRGTAKIALVIPDNFQRDVILKKRPKVQAMIDGQDGNSAGISIGYLSSIAGEFSAEVVQANPIIAQDAKNVRLVNMQPRFWYNPNLESKVYIVPGLLAIIITIITVFMTGMGIVREKEIGTLDQLMVTPIRSYQLVLGKSMPFVILGFAEVLLMIGFIYLLFGIGVAGSIPLLLAESGLFILTTLGIGIFISTISETQQQALFFAWFVMIFGILLSGFFIPIANMPDVIQWITYLNPIQYFLVILREIYLKATPLEFLLPETAAMAAFGITIFSLAVLRFRRKLR